MNLSEMLMPGKTIGIVGGGQLGQMLTFAAKSMGFNVGVLDPVRNCPTAQVADWHILADYDDEDALKEMADRCDVLTYEFENVDVATLAIVERVVPVPQGSNLLAITQDRLLEKAFLDGLNINIAPYATIVELTDIQDVIGSIGFPCVLKTIRGGYDGKGQHVLKRPKDIPACMPLLRLGTCVLEAWIPFEREVSVMVAANASGDIEVFPLAENIHRRNILHETLVPAKCDKEITEEITRVARQIAEGLHLCGVLGIEMFLTEDGNIYVNELAPRPHNSGHYSIEACSISQFEAHIRGICNWPLPQVKLLSPAIMVNILGENMAGVPNLIGTKKDWHFHLYGKEESKTGRKMGHITILTEDLKKTDLEVKETNVWDV